MNEPKYEFRKISTHRYEVYLETGELMYEINGYPMPGGRGWWEASSCTNDDSIPVSVCLQFAKLEGVCCG